MLAKTTLHNILIGAIFGDAHIIATSWTAIRIVCAKTNVLFAPYILFPRYVHSFDTANMHCRAIAHHILDKKMYNISYCPRCSIFRNVSLVAPSVRYGMVQQYVCGSPIAQRNIGLTITPAKIGTHKKAWIFPPERAQSMKTPSAKKSHFY